MNINRSSAAVFPSTGVQKSLTEITSRRLINFYAMEKVVERLEKLLPMAIQSISDYQVSNENGEKKSLLNNDSCQ